MNLTFADSPDIDELNFKRFLLICNELTFVNRPSVHLANNYGTVGVTSGISNLIKEFEDTPIKLNVITPPDTTVNSEFYKKYFELDLENIEFLNIFFEGVKSRWIADLDFEDNPKRASSEFSNFRKWLLINEAEIKSTDIASIERPDQLFSITNKQEALFKFKMLAAEESLRVTSVLYACNSFNTSPVSINPVLNKLLINRLSSDYCGIHTTSKRLGLMLMECIIPDEALIQIPWEEIVEFRMDNKDYFSAWAVEIDRVEATLRKAGTSITYEETLNLLNTEFNPKLLEIKNEIRRIKDERFKNIIKTIKNLVLSGLSMGTLSSLSIPGAILGFIGANLKTPQLTDDIIDSQFKLRDKQLSSGITYQLKVQEFANRQY